MAKKFHLEINPDGQIEADLDGFKGKSCLKEEQDISAMLKGMGLDLSMKKQSMKKTRQDPKVVIVSH